MINLQKSFGQLDIKFKDNEIKKFYQKGCSKSIIPNVAGKLEQMILINTSGGITSGDKLSTRIELDNSSVCTSTQAAEKIYKGSDEPAEINIDLLTSLFFIFNINEPIKIHFLYFFAKFLTSFK